VRVLAAGPFSQIINPGVRNVEQRLAGNFFKRQTQNSLNLEGNMGVSYNAPTVLFVDSFKSLI